MFFGVELNPGRVISQKLKYHLKLKLVALGTTKSNSRNVISVEVEGRRFVLCSLRLKSCEQVSLNLTFLQGTKVSFVHQEGDAKVYLTGNYFLDIGSDDEVEFSSNSDNDSSDDTYEASSSSDEFQPDPNDSDDDDVSSSSSGDGPEAVFTDSDSSSSDDERKQKKNLKNKKQQQQQQKKQKTTPQKKQKQQQQEQKKTPTRKRKVEQPTSSSSSNSDTNKKQKTPQKKQQPQEQLATPHVKGGKETHLGQGLFYKVLRAPRGNGIKAQRGSTVTVGYVGKLQKNRRQFDKNANFSFRLGAGEVIKGWEKGVQGMTVGEKRELRIPGHMAYGKSGVKAGNRFIIPPNAALVFEIELKRVKK